MAPPSQLPSSPHQEHHHQAAIIIQAHFRRHRAQQAYQQQLAAACTLQAHVGRFLAQRQAAGEDAQEQRHARFKAVMARHQDRIQQLEHQKRVIQGLPLEQLEQWEAARHAAATTIQARWRGTRTRQRLARAIPVTAGGGLRPTVCCSPSLPDRDEPSSLVQQQLQPPSERSSSPVGAEASSASIAAAQPTCPAALSSSAALWGLPVMPEESSCLLGGCSKLSGISTAGGDNNPHHSHRWSAIPATHRMLLERQVQMHVAAALADISRLKSMRANQAETDQRLAQLVHQRRAAAHAVQAARRRQRTLHKAEVLHQGLKQLPQQLSHGDADALLGASSLPRPGSSRAARARQAHALALAEASVVERWWVPLKAHESSAAKLADADRPNSDADAEQQQQEALWRSSWAAVATHE